MGHAMQANTRSTPQEGQKQATKPVNPYHLTPASQQALRAVAAEHRRRNMARRAARERVAAWGAL